ncbi:MAG: amidohydrolase family protein, partial [bacterium]
RARGADIILETCPQYLVLTEDIYQSADSHYKITTPPLRREEDREALWQALTEGHIDVVATDHCPFTREQKDGGHGKFHLTPNGLPGVETLFPLLYTFGVAKNRIDLAQLVNLLARKPAEIFGLYPAKGTIQVGSDADLVIWDPSGEYEITADKTHGNADWSPYEGFKIKGKLDFTILRGQVLVENSQFVGKKVFGKLQLFQ